MKLSVIIPVYNVEKYLEQCLNSVVNQTYKDIEIIIVDDGSTDSCGVIIDNYAKKDDRIVVIHKKNGGLVSAYCEGYRYVTAELVTFVDSDDWCDIDMYEQMLNVYDKYNVDMVMCSYAREFKDKSIEADFGISEGLYNDVQEKFFPKTNRASIAASRWNRIFKKYYLDKIINNVDLSTSFAEDSLIGIPYALITKSFYYIDKTFYHYRYTEDPCVSKNANYKIIDDINKIHKTLSNYDVDRKYSKLININTLLLYFKAIANFNDATICEHEKKDAFARLAKEELFKRVLKELNWHCDTIKQNLVKLALKISPTMYFKILVKRSRRRNVAR